MDEPDGDIYDGLDEERALQRRNIVRLALAFTTVMVVVMVLGAGNPTPRHSSPNGVVGEEQPGGGRGGKFLTLKPVLPGSLLTPEQRQLAKSLAPLAVLSVTASTVDLGWGCNEQVQCNLTRWRVPNGVTDASTQHGASTAAPYHPSVLTDPLVVYVGHEGGGEDSGLTPQTSYLYRLTTATSPGDVILIEQQLQVTTTARHPPKQPDITLSFPYTGSRYTGIVVRPRGKDAGPPFDDSGGPITRIDLLDCSKLPPSTSTDTSAAGDSDSDSGSGSGADPYLPALVLSLTRESWLEAQCHGLKKGDMFLDDYNNKVHYDPGKHSWIQDCDQAGTREHIVQHRHVLNELPVWYVRQLQPATTYHWTVRIHSSAGLSPPAQCHQDQTVTTKPANELAIVTLDVSSSKFVQDSIDLSLADKRAYAEFWGYDFHVVNSSLLEEGIPPAWGKIKALQHFQDQYNWLYWVDTDTRIMNYTWRVYDLVHDSEGKGQNGAAVHFIVAQEGNTPPIFYNTGSFLLQTQFAWGRDFLEMVYLHNHTSVHNDKWEQTEIIALMHDPVIRPHIWTGIDLHAPLNEIVHIDHPLPLHEFIAHFAGCQNQGQCYSLFTKYYGRGLDWSQVIDANVARSKDHFPWVIS